MNKFIAILIVLLLGPLFFLNLFSITIKHTLNPEFLKKELGKINAYQKTYDNVPEIVAMFGTPEDDEAKRELEGTVDLFTKYLKPADMQEITELLIEGGASGGKVDHAKNQRVTEKLTTLFKQKYEMMPLCVGEEEGFCRKPGVSFDQTLKEMNDSGALAGTPYASLVSFDQTGTPEISLTKGLSQVQNKTTPFKYLSYLTLFIVFSLVVLMSRLFGGSWKKIPAPLGAFLIFYAGMSFLTAFIVLKITPAALLSALPKPLEILKRELVTPLLLDSARAVSASFNTNLIWLTGLGVILIAIGIILHYVIKPKEEKTIN